MSAAGQLATMDHNELKRRQTAIAETGGIHPPFEIFYILSLHYAADRSEAAFQRYDGAVTVQETAELIVATVQEALGHAAAISRFFWPASKAPHTQARGERLRAAFAVDDGSPLCARTLRNAFEHFDERLDNFLLQHHVGAFFPSPLVADHRLADDDLGSIFKLVDPDHGICVLLGEKFEFNDIRGEVRRVLRQANAMSGAGGRLAPGG